MKKTIIGLAALAMLSGTAGFAAAGDANYEEQIRQLIEQNKRLTERVMKLEEHITRQSHHGEAVAATEHGGTETSHSLLQAINDHVELSGLIEVEMEFADIDGHTSAHDEEESDINVSTVEVALDAQLSEWSSGHLLVLYEEDGDADFNIDEATITLGNLEKFPLYLTAGKMYVPFGSFETNMVSDPLTLDLGETNETVVQVGFESGGFYGSVYAFNGDIVETGDDDEIDAWGANFGYVYEDDHLSFDGGIDYISNIADSDEISHHVYHNHSRASHEIDDYVDGVAVHAALSMGPFSVIGEYVAALDEFENLEFGFDNDGAEPEAWNLEAAFTTELMGKETTFALGYQGTDEAVELSLPEDAYLGTVRMEIFHHTGLAFEYAHLEYYGEDEGSRHDDADLATLQLEVEF